ncbi:MAG: carboxypeptidase-like regulatory domain-containing protein, partial [Treponema sp.]|nr:carboxypeptidase-like regulatory domain-containing protein [Treponema sp.]
MDTGNTWYISSSTIITKDSPGSVSLSKQSDRVIEVREGSRKYYLYASRIANASFTGKIASVGTDPAKNVQRALGSGLGGVKVVVTNLNDRANELTATTDGEGKFKVDGAIPGDVYKITVEDQTTTVTPAANGDDVGTITITVTGGANFKTSIKPQSSSVDMQCLYADLNAYTFIITVQNTGTADCLAPTYALDFDSGLRVISTPASQILGTIEPGKSKTIEVTLSCQPVQAEYEFKKIGISITDVEHKIWEDSVSLKFNKAPVNFNIKADSVISGVIITPNARAYTFSGTSSSLTMPWSTREYLVVFSGATADTEAVYSMGVHVTPDSNFTDFTDLGNYESNDTENAATAIKVSDKIMSYLHKNDIDYYKINLGTTAPQIKPVSMTDFAYT